MVIMMMVSLVLGPCPALPCPALSCPGNQQGLRSLPWTIHQPLQSKSGIAVDRELATDADADGCRCHLDGRTDGKFSLCVCVYVAFFFFCLIFSLFFPSFFCLFFRTRTLGRARGRTDNERAVCHGIRVAIIIVVVAVVFVVVILGARPGKGRPERGRAMASRRPKSILVRDVHHHHHQRRFRPRRSLLGSGPKAADVKAARRSGQQKSLPPRIQNSFVKLTENG
ncbi:uncharacterized protein LY79DRAFT_4484 [Colletotrichum navitas]|uniref:Uncharacterized protein n=1 Tax=Colletotrichum navitas TaxID=681940 RepID=A0AAD8VCF0_9PEZI|nr:uncharacterized protein LY79DRAFT_4484 [Colletotrichum navitas]KAK1600033.1 hypothetical protein LY79DRAFT_4484 [Colletotrichum navitas]